MSDPVQQNDSSEERLENAASPESERGILCARCEHLNPLDKDRCESCKAHLYVMCHRCGEKNPRVHSRCKSCRRRLHLGLSERIGAKKSSGPINLLYLAGAVVLVVAGVIAVIKYAGVRLW